MRRSSAAASACCARLRCGQLRRLGLERGGRRRQPDLLAAQHDRVLAELAGQTAQHEHAAQRVLRLGWHGQQSLGREQRQPLDQRQQRLHRLGGSRHARLCPALLGGQCVHPGGHHCRGRLRLAQPSDRGDPVIGQALFLGGSGDSAGGRLALRSQLGRARFLSLFHGATGSLFLGRSGRMSGDRDQGDQGERAIPQRAPHGHGSTNCRSSRAAAPGPSARAGSVRHRQACRP